jgi:hypothetical protein
VFLTSLATMKRFRKWRKKTKQKDEFDKCLKSKRDYLLRYGRLEKGVRAYREKTGKSLKLTGFLLKSFIENGVRDDNALKQIIEEKLPPFYECADRNKKKPCVDDKKVLNNKCSDKKTYQKRAREEARKWTVSYLEDEINKLGKTTRRGEYEENLLKTYRKRLETIKEEPEPRSRNSWPRFPRNSWGVEEESMAVVGPALKF